MNTKAIREDYYNLTQERLSKITGIPLRTIQGWDQKNNLKEWMAKLLILALCKMEDGYNEDWVSDLLSKSK